MIIGHALLQLIKKSVLPHLIGNSTLEMLSSKTELTKDYGI